MSVFRFMVRCDHDRYGGGRGLTGACGLESHKQRKRDDKGERPNDDPANEMREYRTDRVGHRKNTHLEHHDRHAKEEAVPGPRRDPRDRSGHER